MFLTMKHYFRKAVSLLPVFRTVVNHGQNLREIYETAWNFRGIETRGPDRLTNRQSFPASCGTFGKDNTAIN